MTTVADRIAPRDDIALMDGYHSPQVSVDVRLNTNESPLAPPPAFVAAFAAHIADRDGVVACIGHVDPDAVR